MNIAIELGYDVVSDELREVFAERRRESIEAIGDEELSLNELEQVAGGTTNMANGQYCSSDYDPNDWCWADDRCLSSWNFYRAKGYCKSTMEENESCWNVGHCNAGIEQYSKCYQNELLY